MKSKILVAEKMAYFKYVKQKRNCHEVVDGETESKSEDMEQVCSHMINFFHVARDDKPKHWRVTSRVLLHGNSFPTVLLTIRYQILCNNIYFIWGTVSQRLLCGTQSIK